MRFAMMAWLVAVLLAATVALGAPEARDPDAALAALPDNAEPLPDPEQKGGEEGSVVQVANLIYSRVKSSECFSDHFLLRADKESAISTSRRFHSAKLGSEELFQYPFVIMTGEGTFSLSKAERENMKKYCESGGFLLASAGCSSKEWDKSFRAEMGRIWPETKLSPLPMSHPVFHTITDIEAIKTKHGKPKPIEGISVNDRLVLIYSQDGLNDTQHTQGCCCCGGNEIKNAEHINMNILAYALCF